MRQPNMTPHEIAALYEPQLDMPVFAEDMLGQVHHSYEAHRLRMAGGTVALYAGVTVRQLIDSLGPRLRRELTGEGLLGPYFSVNGVFEPNGIGVWIPLPPEQEERSLGHRRTVIKRRISVVE